MAAQRCAGERIRLLALPDAVRSQTLMSQLDMSPGVLMAEVFTWMMHRGYASGEITVLLATRSLPV